MAATKADDTALIRQIERKSRRLVETISIPEYRQVTEGDYSYPAEFRRVRFKGGKKWHLVRIRKGD